MSLTADSRSAEERLTLYLGVSGLAHEGASATALTGDASDRRYFRVVTPDRPSRIAAVHSGPIRLETLPFAIVADLFARMPVPVPRIHGHSDDLGVVLVDDLGDLTLQAWLSSASDDQRLARYREAVALIVTLQQRGRALASPSLLPYQLAFDVDKLLFELHFFTTHFLEAHLGAHLAPHERHGLETAYRNIVEELASEPRVLCHRDYHSRNLMLHEGRLWLIDFQDARMGPDTYDLVSLLRDAYVEVTEPDVDQLIGTFLDLCGADDGYRRDFRRRFDLMAVQRTLKALGTFGFQATSRGNRTYLASVPRCLRVLDTTTRADARFAGLRKHLARFVDLPG
jgi:aminoglycoside/choline kinase family phosphotransferase